MTSSHEGGKPKGTSQAQPAPSAPQQSPSSLSTSTIADGLQHTVAPAAPTSTRTTLEAFSTAEAAGAELCQQCAAQGGIPMVKSSKTKWTITCGRAACPWQAVSRRLLRSSQQQSQPAPTMWWCEIVNANHSHPEEAAGALSSPGSAQPHIQSSSTHWRPNLPFLAGPSSAVADAAPLLPPSGIGSQHRSPTQAFQGRQRRSNESSPYYRRPPPPYASQHHQHARLQSPDMGPSSQTPWSQHGLSSSAASLRPPAGPPRAQHPAMPSYSMGRDTAAALPPWRRAPPPTSSLSSTMDAPSTSAWPPQVSNSPEHHLPFWPTARHVRLSKLRRTLRRLQERVAREKEAQENEAQEKEAREKEAEQGQEPH